jgi:nicotinamidase/pyrazinamidase
MARTVFWDVDTQRDFMEPGGALYVPGAETLVANLERLTHHARTGAGIIVASMCDHTAADAEISATPDFRHTFPPHCLRGTPGQDRIAATRLRRPVFIENGPYERTELERLVAAHTGEIVVKKQQFDVFTNPATALLLEILRPEHAVVYGVAQEVCVDRAIVGLAGRGVRVWFVEDASRALDPQAAVRCAAAWRVLGVRFVSTADVVDGHALPQS